MCVLLCIFFFCFTRVFFCVCRYILCHLYYYLMLVSLDCTSCVCNVYLVCIVCCQVGVLCFGHVVVVVLHNIRNKGCKQNVWCLAAHRACRVALLLTGKPSTIERFFLPCLSWMELKTSIRDSRRRKTLISQKRNVQGKKTPRVSSHAASSSLYVCPLISVCWAITI